MACRDIGPCAIGHREENLSALIRIDAEGVRLFPNEMNRAICILAEGCSGRLILSQEAEVGHIKNDSFHKFLFIKIKRGLFVGLELIQPRTGGKH